MEQLPHFILGAEYVHQLGFKTPRGMQEKTPPEKNVREHAHLLGSQYREAILESQRDIESVEDNELPSADGYYLNIQANITLEPKDLHKQKGPRLMALRKEENDMVSATVFLPKRHSNWLSKRLTAYENNGANKNLINNIKNIRKSEIIDFFSIDEDKAKFDILPSGCKEKFELWFYKDEKIAHDKGEITLRLNSMGIKILSSFLEFETNAVVLVETTKDRLKIIPSSLEFLGEARFFRDATVLPKSSLLEQSKWTKLLAADIELVDNPVLVGVLDTGARKGNALLDPFMPDKYQRHAVSYDSKDREYHGVLMAGLVLHGDLADWLFNSAPHRVYSNLVTVKCKPSPDEPPTAPELFGVVMEDAISQTKDEGAVVNCSAITGDRVQDGMPSSWSAAIDEILYSEGHPKSLLLLAAGNIEETNGLTYPEFNIITPPRDPNQSWNAISVGAITHKSVITDPFYKDIRPLAAPGQLSPYSPCSMGWDLIKPDIVVEGGNALDSGGTLSAAPIELNMVVPTVKATGEKFDCMFATSGATAVAARFASIVQHEHPKLGALTIRALMIHSAEWSPEMKGQFRTNNGALDIDSMLHVFGYGEPDINKAVASYLNSATFIIERKFSPFSLDSHNSLKASAMDLIELPWPKELLMQMENIPVRLKITLSYYIQPSPGTNLYKYESFALRFDLINQNETLEQFVQRVSNVPSEDVEKSKNKSSRWEIGISKRNKGSISSDYITETAINLADCRYISITPAYGWWHKRKWKKDLPPVIQYALIVTLETPEQNIDIYSSVKNIIGNSIKVEI